MLLDVAEVADLPTARHVCWVVEDASSYATVAADIVRRGADLRHKTVVFGPEGSQRSGPAVDAAMAADPRVAYLGGGPLDRERMFSMFHEQSAIARAEGFLGLWVVADMDWLLPLDPSSEAIVGFELLLDRVVAELDATVVCAYRRTSFRHSAIGGSLSVHPVVAGVRETPPFRFCAAGGGSWRLSGEVDYTATSILGAAVAAASTNGPCTVDVSALDFIDVAGMRALVHATAGLDTPVVLEGASQVFRRAWQLCEFAAAAPRLTLS